MSEWIEFVEKKPNPKTRIVGVMSKHSGCELGEIRWHGPWRHYVFVPTIEFQTIHSDRCLSDISENITKMNEEKKNELNNGTS